MVPVILPIGGFVPVVIPIVSFPSPESSDGVGPDEIHTADYKEISCLVPDLFPGSECQIDRLADDERESLLKKIREDDGSPVGRGREIPPSQIPVRPDYVGVGFVRCIVIGKVNRWLGRRIGEPGIDTEIVLPTVLDTGEIVMDLAHQFRPILPQCGPIDLEMGILLFHLVSQDGSGLELQGYGLPEDQGHRKDDAQDRCDRLLTVPNDVAHSHGDEGQGIDHMFTC